MIVYQTDGNGIFVGTTEADESPLEPGVFHIPGGCVEQEPPELADGERARWTDGAWVVEPIPPVEPEEPPEPALMTKTHKATIWRRLTDEEAEQLDAALSAAPLRLRRIFEAAQYLDTNDPDYPTLRAGVVAALGEERAAEVLAPDH